MAVSITRLLGQMRRAKCCFIFSCHIASTDATTLYVAFLLPRKPLKHNASVFIFKANFQKFVFKFTQRFMNAETLVH